MNNLSTELEFLIKEVSAKFGTKISTPTDFTTLVNDIESVTGEQVSESTLKRIWGYVRCESKPSSSVLNILSHYIGRKSFRNLCLELQETSGFIEVDKVLSAELDKGATVILKWMPDRVVEVEHLDGYSFIIRDSGTSKRLREGDMFDVIEFIKGHPLYISGLMRDGKVLPTYVAGKAMGLTGIEVY